MDAHASTSPIKAVVKYVPTHSHREERAARLELGRAKKAAAETEFQERQASWRDLEKKKSKVEKAARRAAMDRREAEMNQPGYGPDRWCWPKASEEPRGWTSGGDIPLVPGTQNPGCAAAGPGAALGLPSPERRSPSSRIEKMTESPM